MRKIMQVIFLKVSKIKRVNFVLKQKQGYEKIDIVGVERDACGAAIGAECPGERNREGR